MTATLEREELDLLVFGKEEIPCQWVRCDQTADWMALHSPCGHPWYTCDSHYAITEPPKKVTVCVVCRRKVSLVRWEKM